MGQPLKDINGVVLKPGMFVRVIGKGRPYAVVKSTYGLSVVLVSLYCSDYHTSTFTLTINTKAIGQEWSFDDSTNRVLTLENISVHSIPRPHRKLIIKTIKGENSVFICPEIVTAFLPHFKEFM